MAANPQHLLDKAYDPLPVEEKWAKFWLDEKINSPEVPSDKPKFSAVLPPPNVTGSLHMGHALCFTLPDIIARWKRMKGYNVLWLPGTDHASIAVHNVIEKVLREKGLSREKLGREEFLKIAWDWKEKYGGIITGQLKKLGCSLDWSRERFTMDAGFSRAVRHVFVTLYQEGLIYRDYYLVNHCPRCGTVLSDVEISHQELLGKLWYVRYPLADGQGAVVVAQQHDLRVEAAPQLGAHQPRQRQRQVLLDRVPHRHPGIAAAVPRVEHDDAHAPGRGVERELLEPRRGPAQQVEHDRAGARRAGAREAVAGRAGRDVQLEGGARSRRDRGEAAHQGAARQRVGHRAGEGPGQAHAEVRARAAHHRDLTHLFDREDHARAAVARAHHRAAHQAPARHAHHGVTAGLVHQPRQGAVAGQPLEQRDRGLQLAALRDHRGAQPQRAVVHDREGDVHGERDAVRPGAQHELAHVGAPELRGLEQARQVVGGDVVRLADAPHRGGLDRPGRGRRQGQRQEQRRGGAPHPRSRGPASPVRPPPRREVPRAARPRSISRFASRSAMAWRLS